jgi:hypothetical protein
MDQHSICLYLNRKGLSAHAIHDEFVQGLWSDTVAYSTVIFYLRASHWTAGKEEQHSDRLPMLSTTQFSRPLVKPRSHQCGNSQSPCEFQLQQFGDAWRGILDLLSSIWTGFPTAWQRRNGKFELIDQSNYSDAERLNGPMNGKHTHKISEHLENYQNTPKKTLRVFRSSKEHISMDDRSITSIPLSIMKRGWRKYFPFSDKYFLADQKSAMRTESNHQISISNCGIRFILSLNVFKWHLHLFSHILPDNLPLESRSLNRRFSASVTELAGNANHFSRWLSQLPLGPSSRSMRASWLQVFRLATWESSSTILLFKRFAIEIVN